MKKLVDGKVYWLGATHGTFKESSMVFSLGNCFVPVASTVHRNGFNPRYTCSDPICKHCTAPPADQGKEKTWESGSVCELVEINGSFIVRDTWGKFETVGTFSTHAEALECYYNNDGSLPPDDWDEASERRMQDGMMGGR